MVMTDSEIKKHYSDNYQYDGYLQATKGNFLERYWFRNRIDRIVKDLRRVPHKNILEIGCGTGAITEGVSIRLPDAKITATDISSWAINQCKKYHPDSRVKYEIADAFNLPYKNESVDCVVAVEIIEHVIDQRGILKEVERVLKPGGLLIITAPAKYHPVWEFKWLRNMISIDKKKDYSVGGKHFEPVHYSYVASDLKKILTKNLVYLTHEYISLFVNIYFVARKSLTKKEEVAGRKYNERI